MVIVFCLLISVFIWGVDMPVKVSLGSMYNAVG